MSVFLLESGSEPGVHEGEGPSIVDGSLDTSAGCAITFGAWGLVLIMMDVSGKQQLKLK